MVLERGGGVSESGRVFQINISDGGVPKRGMREALVTRLGLVGDRQRDREHHGGLERAVTLYSLDRILDLQKEGHPVYPGAMGENLTLAGVDWDVLSEGTRLLIRNTVLLELTRPASPCSNIAGSFKNGEISRVSHKANPGWSRWCACTLNEGEIRVGDEVVVFLNKT